LSAATARDKSSTSRVSASWCRGTETGEELAGWAGAIGEVTAVVGDEVGVSNGTVDGFAIGRVVGTTVTGIPALGWTLEA
jgi:hypothetical protein